MTVLVIPTRPIPSQTLTCVLTGQQCKINIYQKSTGVFMDLYVSERLIQGGVICEIANGLVRSAYLGFIGNLAFFDRQYGSPPMDPKNPDLVVAAGLGTRYFLAYMT